MSCKWFNITSNKSCIGMEFSVFETSLFSSSQPYQKLDFGLEPACDSIRLIRSHIEKSCSGWWNKMDIDLYEQTWYILRKYRTFTLTVWWVRFIYLLKSHIHFHSGTDQRTSWIQSHSLTDSHPLQWRCHSHCLFCWGH